MNSKYYSKDSMLIIYEIRSNWRQDYSWHVKNLLKLMLAFFTTFESILFYHIATKRAPSTTEPNDID